MSANPEVRRILCAGDRFIEASALAGAARARFDGATLVEHSSGWPDEPFGSVAGVREAAGDPAQLAKAGSGVGLILTHLAPITDEVLAAAGPGLRAVGVTRGGPVNVDLAAATRRGVPVAHLPGRNLGAVAEFVIGAMISVTRNIGAASRGMARGRWDGTYFRYGKCGPELRAATVGLVGFGAVGMRVAELLRAFGSTVVAHDPYADPDKARELGVRLVELPELLGICDIVSVHARLTDSTRGMFGAEAFSAMKPGACFVNTARGELVDEAALTEALADGRIRAAALDVFHPEPPAPDHPLLARDDVLATPHLAGASRQVAQDSARRIVDAVADFLRTGRLEFCANPQVLAPSSR
ncbi:2-hydroxyacid dehydrogenase [Streptomyces sp. NPDC052236]|uniref:2-hydroxyacid dehydrogenase n=1 Tax=Streptomyces sp. NPDC052236 TaxID=3365686 RepID=UPI0037D7D62D